MTYGVRLQFARVEFEMFLIYFPRLPPPEKSAPKTFYFGMDGALQNESRDCVDQHMEQIQSRLQAKEVNGAIDLDYTDDVSNVFFFLITF